MKSENARYSEGVSNEVPFLMDECWKSPSISADKDHFLQGANGFQVSIADDHEALSQRAAVEISAAITRQPDLLLCAASGATPARTYDLLAAEARLHPERFRYLRVICLDEWGGLRPDETGSSEQQLRRQLAMPLALSTDRFVFFQGNAERPQDECARIAAIMKAQGPIDIAVLGLGQNGHLGLNEPAAELKPHAHVAELHPTSRQHPMLQDALSVPTYGLTLGMLDLMSSRRVLLLVSGGHKREVLTRLLTGGLTTALPGSLLRMHPDALCLCDRAAASGLSGIPESPMNRTPKSL